MDESRTWTLMARKIAREATTEELAELEAILKAHPDLYEAVTVIESIKATFSDDFGYPEKEENDLLDRKLAEIEENLQKRVTKISTPRFAEMWKPLLVAASLVLILLLSFSYYYFRKPNIEAKTSAMIPKSHNAFIADTPTTITLQDGTKVWINSGSTLKCAPDFGQKYREVMLSGEAYFEVTHNAGKPFIVQAGSFMKVKVLGTKFNVKAFPKDPYVEASLISGKISIDVKDRPDEPIILKPHQKITFRLKDTAEVSSFTNKTNSRIEYQLHSIKLNPVDQHISELSWLRGELAFTDILFGELAFDLERSFKVNIEFKEDQIKDYHLTGVFKGENLNEVLQALQVTTPFHYNISGRKVTIYR